jgi:hypothetical protein
VLRTNPRENREAVADNARRRKQGLGLAKGVEHGWMCVEMLVAHGYLDPEDTENERAVGAAITRLLSACVEQWMKGSQ